MKKEYNECNKCPYFAQSSDYWCECDEWCEAGNTYKCMYKCRYSLFVRHVLYLIHTAKNKYYDRCADKAFMKEEKEKYKERIRLGMTEDEYEQMQYEEITKERKYYYIKRDNCWWQRVSESIYNAWDLEKKTSYHKLSDLEIEQLN